MNEKVSTGSTVELAPRYALPLIIILMGAALTVFLWWLGLLLTLFGIFLLIQTSIIRLRFTPTALEVYRGVLGLEYSPIKTGRIGLFFGQPCQLYSTSRR